VATPHVASTAGRHLHRGIDLRSYDIESTRGPANSGAGVPGVVGADASFGGVKPAASITLFSSCYLACFLSLTHTTFFLFFQATGVSAVEIGIIKGN
jgi:hypothetical protein